MKPYVIIFLLLVLTCSLWACDWVTDEYLSATPHVEQSSAPSTEPEKDPLPVVTNRNELRGAVLSFIRNWTERGVMTVQHYEGDMQEDLTETLRYATQEDPIGAYAVDFADAQIFGDSNSGRIEVAIVFRRSIAEIDGIVSVNGNNSAYSRIQHALTTYDSALTLRVRNYQDTDFAAYIEDYCLQHPDQVAAVPAVSAEVYPKEGDTRILELHFSYPDARDTMRSKQAEINTILSSAASYISTGGTAKEKTQLLYRFLCTRFDYQLEEELPAMPAYRLLCEGVAHSRSFASVCFAECEAAGIDCFLIRGTLYGIDHEWNMLRLDDAYYYVDFMRSQTYGERELRLLTTEELLDDGYAWDAEAYPATPVLAQEPLEETEATEPHESSAEPET